MADGTWQGRMRLAACGGQLRAHCGCGREAMVDPRAWLAQGLGGLPLTDLETRLRCVCGARRATLSADTRRPASQQGIWAFR